MICEIICFYQVEYTLDTYKDLVVSKCPCFITKDTELVTAYQIKNGMKKYESEDDYEDYIKKLEEMGIEDARTQMENMYILDFLIMNEDRHLNNFGIIRDVNNLRWISVAPIFDNGMALKVDYYSEGEAAISGYGRLFYEVKPFDDIIKVVKNIKRIDISKLDGIVEEFEALLTEYQSITKMSDERIQLLCVLLDRQISKLRDLTEE